MRVVIPPFCGFLRAKPLYYKEIDHQRVHSAYALLKDEISHPPAIHIVGTNGKGSTGRMIAHLSYSSGLSVGHFSSPHILRFNERIWIDGDDSSDEVLEIAHRRLYSYLGAEMSEELSYFEYTTLLALVLFESVDLVVLEAGLGGEFDATNVCDKVLSIITPIGVDHQAFLGETIDEIARTKIRSIQKQVLIAPQVYPEVLEIAEEICLERGAKLYICSDSIDESRVSKIREIALPKSWGDYLIDNALVALKALDILDTSYAISHLKSLELFGRFYQLTANIRIDVGHNPLAAKAIVKALDRKVVLIYNSLDDKDYEEVLRILKPRIERVEILSIRGERAATIVEIEEALSRVGIEYSFYDGTIDEERDYLVFGSFYVVEEFLKKWRVDVSK
ncbi:MAG: bifunctional folylpolyglutamate synthase/dihydrofolate synthase [Campylobacterota bacterium]|nr:bifunctional folylpolyglutamate synthase/dihydrofolate synthase [Campylobacterota bacterium]